MNTIELMLTGKIEMPLFVHMFKSNHLLQKEIDGLIPTDAITNTEHDLWKSMSYEALQKTNFCLSSFIEHLCKFDNSPGDNLNLFGTIRRIYTFASPGISCTNIYHDTYDLFVSVVQNCFYGPEVSNLVTQIINESLTYKTKKKRTEMAKKEIYIQFHAVNAKRPRWIQGPEWPMGIYSPMRFISHSRREEVVIYLFEDNDTGEKRAIEQFY